MEGFGPECAQTVTILGQNRGSGTNKKNGPPKRREAVQQNRDDRSGLFDHFDVVCGAAPVTPGYQFVLDLLAFLQRG